MDKEQLQYSLQGIGTWNFAADFKEFCQGKWIPA
jgi:hypothetical protein